MQTFVFIPRDLDVKRHKKRIFAKGTIKHEKLEGGIRKLKADNRFTILFQKSMFRGNV